MLNSVAIIQSGRDVPRGVIFCATLLTRPSRFVVVPFFSPYAAAGSTMSAFRFELLIIVSMLIKFLTCANARCTSPASATSDIGSDPKSTRHSIFPAAAAFKISIASPALFWGVKPAATAPRTLPRRKTGRTFAFGTTPKTSASACRVNTSFSAKFGRPTTTTTCPRPSCSFISADVNVSRTTCAWCPGSKPTVRQAYGLKPESREENSTIRALRFWAASRTRR